MFATIPDLLPPSCRRAGAAADQRARRWAGRSSAAAWRPSSGRTGRRTLRRRSISRPRRPPRSARSTRRPPSTAAAGVQAAVSRHAESAVESRPRPAPRHLRHLSGATIAAIDTREIYDEIAARLREELDYAPRGQAHAALPPHSSRAAAISPCPGRPELSTGRLLTMDWLEGRAAARLQEPPPETRNRIARMFDAWCLP